MATRARPGGVGGAAAGQLGLALPEKKSWGGRREGAGRPKGDRPRIPHRERPRLSRRHPVHVTLRALPHVWNLRSRRAFAVVRAALAGVLARGDAGVVHFSVQGNHLHLLVEAEDAAALANAVRALAIRLAKGLNRMMGRQGPVFADRYHAHALGTPREVRHALAYVLQNHRGHMARLRRPASCGPLDPFSSAALFDGWSDPPPAPIDPAALGLSPPRTWLLTGGWRRGPAQQDEPA